MEVKDALRRFRQGVGLNQEELADRLGIKRQAYQPYETGKVTPSVGMIIKMSQVFDVSADYLLGLSDEPRPKPADALLVNAIINCRDSIQQVLNEVDRLKGQ